MEDVNSTANVNYIPEYPTLPNRTVSGSDFPRPVFPTCPPCYVPSNRQWRVQIHSSMLWYGTVLTYGILKSVVMKRKLLSARFYHKRSKTYIRGSYSVVLQVHGVGAHTIIDARFTLSRLCPFGASSLRRRREAQALPSLGPKSRIIANTSHLADIAHTPFPPELRETEGVS